MAGSKLSINTFAEALLNYTGYPSVIVSNARPKDNPVACGFNSMVQVPEQYRFDLLMQPGAEIVISVHVNEEFSTQLIVEANKLLFDHNFECAGQQAVQTFRADAPRHAKLNFKLTIFTETILHRADFRIGDSAWFTAILNGRRVLQIRPNGDFFYDQLRTVIRREAQLLARDGGTNRLAVEEQLLGSGVRTNRHQDRRERGLLTPPENQAVREQPGGREAMARPTSPDYFENLPSTSGVVNRGPPLRGMAARVNNNSVRSTLQRRLILAGVPAISPPVDSDSD